MRSAQVCLDVAGKPEKNWSVNDLADAFEVQYNFTHKGHKFAIRKRIDSEGNETEELELLIDNILYKDHPYIDKDFGKWRLCCIT